MHTILVRLACTHTHTQTHTCAQACMTMYTHTHTHTYFPLKYYIRIISHKIWIILYFHTLSSV